MRKVLCTLCALALVALTAGAFAKGPCNLKTLEKRNYCAKCDDFLDKEDIKSNKCKKHDEKIAQAEVCLKVEFMGCHNGPQEKAYN